VAFFLVFGHGHCVKKIGKVQRAGKEMLGFQSGGGRFGRVLSILGVDVLCRRAWVCRRLNSWRGIGAREHVSR